MIDTKQVQFEREYADYGKSIYRYFYFRTSSHEMAEDLASIVFTNLWKKRKERVEIKNVKALLYTMAHGALVDYYRSAKNKLSVSIELVDASNVRDNDNTQVQLEIDDDTKLLHKYLDKLKLEYKEILILYYIEELKITEIANILNKKETTVRVTIHRAIAALKKLYE